MVASRVVGAVGRLDRTEGLLADYAVENSDNYLPIFRAIALTHSYRILSETGAQDVRISL